MSEIVAGEIEIGAEELSCSEDGLALEQAAQRGSGTSVLGSLKEQGGQILV